MALLRLFVICGCICSTAALHAALLPAGSYFQEVGGLVVGEAENFHSRTGASATKTWKIAPDEVLAGDGAVAITNARGGQYIQSLADNTSGGGNPNAPPIIEYRMNITTIGTYQLYLRWEGNGVGSGTSDSIYADIAELKDGVGANPIADYYLYGHNGTDANFSTLPWDGNAGKELTTVGTEGAATWNITTPGIYTLRISQREDGSAVDAWVFTTGAAPTGNGPAESLVAIPEPTALAWLIPAGLVAAWMRKRRTA